MGQLFRIKDRKDQKFLLSPTHEEEITQLVAGTTTSYKQLPLRLYQISTYGLSVCMAAILANYSLARKYRDERRPRAGLLRGKEFLMKDLYTFDDSAEAAKKTYDEVIEAYHKIFQKLGIPFLMARVIPNYKDWLTSIRPRLTPVIWAVHFLMNSSSLRHMART